MRRQFITLEGIEGAGKTTALQFIEQYLQQANKMIVCTREPGGTEIAEEIRNVLLYPASRDTMQPKTELLLMFAGREQHIHAVIKPTLAAGKWVLSDRYIDASYAYQGGGRGIPVTDIQLLDKVIVKDIYPDLTLLLDLPAELGVARAASRGKVVDRIEAEKVDFFVRVRNAYLERAKEAPGRIKIIDASQSIENVQTQIRHVLDEFLKRVPA